MLYRMLLKNAPMTVVPVCTSTSHAHNGTLRRMGRRRETSLPTMRTEEIKNEKPPQGQMEGLPDHDESKRKRFRSALQQQKPKWEISRGTHQHDNRHRTFPKTATDTNYWESSRTASRAQEVKSPNRHAHRRHEGDPPEQPWTNRRYPTHSN